MKTKEQFKHLEKEFHNTIKGKKEEEFVISVIEFMDNHNFEQPVIVNLYNKYDGVVMFFTDHFSNDNGLVLMDLYGKLFAVFAESKSEVKKFLGNHGC